MSSAKDSFVEIAAGAAVFSAGEVGREFYIIESGQVEVASHTLGPGDVLGETALLDNQAHPATAAAKTRTRLLRIDRELLPDVLRHNGEIGLALLRQLAARQLQSTHRLHDISAELARLQATRAPAASAAGVPASPAPPAPAPAPSAAPPPSAAARALPSTPESPPAVRMALLVSGTGQMIALDPARSEFLVGRPDPATGMTPEIDLGPFDSNRTLSRRHAKIVSEGAQYFLREDNATMNGTYVNGERLQTGVNVALKPGDKLRFGSIEVELVGA